ncbi:hypothetical protein AURDEDRAFT_113341 [Auricularia subglabra TFB-10046 SS5]|nr:hypothetical protein AURDEDRAFT_113341 [Auricularia subglabra TFB-10046 SS5]
MRRPINTMKADRVLSAPMSSMETTMRECMSYSRVHKYQPRSGEGHPWPGTVPELRGQALGGRTTHESSPMHDQALRFTAKTHPSLSSTPRDAHEALCGQQSLPHSAERWKRRNGFLRTSQPQVAKSCL